jgi:hypothetical protein
MAKGAECSVLSQHPQALGHGVGQRAWTVAADFFINAFESPD